MAKKKGGLTLTLRLSSEDMLCERCRNISITFDTGPREESFDERGRDFSAQALIGDVAS